MRQIEIAITVLAPAYCAGAIKADDLPKRFVELQLFDQFVGTWVLQPTCDVL